MNNEEKKVLRRKRQTLVTYLKVTENHLQLLMTNKCLSKEAADKIRNELSNQAKVNKLLEVLPTCCGRQAFEALCDVVGSGTTSWLADELQAELKAEKGDLKIEEYIERESSVLVYREFGNSKRLSEGEKKDMLLLVAKKTQCTKEAWRSQLVKTEEALAYENDLNAEKDELCRSLIDKIKSFLMINAPRLRVGPGNDQSLTMREALEGDEDNTPLLVVVDEVLSRLQKLASDALLERDRLHEERSRSLRVLSVTDPGTKLDREIELALQDADHRLSESEREVDRNDTRAKALDDQLATSNLKWNREIEQRDNSIKTLRGHLDKCHEKIRNLDECMENLQHELANTKDELAKYRSKSELLEKSRRLGYSGVPAPPANPDSRTSDSRIGTAKSSAYKKTRKGSKTSRY